MVRVEVPEVIQQWGAEWDQQQEYVFLYDAYKALQAAIDAGQPTARCVNTDLQNAQMDLGNFLLEDLESIRTDAEAVTAILSGV